MKTQILNHERYKGTKYCKTAEVFQDVPFSWADTYKYLDDAYPDAKFILSVRDSPEQWYESKINFAKKRYGGKLPDIEDIKKSSYVYPGWSYFNTFFSSNGTFKDLHNKEKLIARYKKHSQEVIDYFRDKPEKLLVVNVSRKDSYGELCRFIGVENKYDGFLWKIKPDIDLS